VYNLFYQLVERPRVWIQINATCFRAASSWS